MGITTLYIDEGQNLNFAMPVEWLAQIKPISNSAPADITGNVDSGRYANQWPEQADRLLDAKDWNGLYALAQRWKAAEPNSSEAWRIAGTALNDLEKPALAEKEFAQAAKLNPANDLAWLGLGLSAMKQDHFQQALPAFIRYTQLKPEDALGFTLVGFMQSQLGDTPAAIAAYKKALNLDPNDSGTWEELGRTYLDLDMNEQAGNALQQAYRLDPKDVSIVSLYGEQALVVGDYQKALKLSHAALEINPAYPNAWFVKGSANLFMNNYAQATEDLLNAVSLDSDFVSAWYNLAIAHRQNYKTREAMQAYRVVLKLDPKAAAELYPKIKP